MGSYHFIGIGGIGMSSLAYILLQRGHKISGSDLCMNERIDFLRSLGAKIFEGHDAKVVPCDAIVVYHNRINPSNPEFLNDNQKMHRLDLLTKTINDMPIYAVVGAHGKTSTTGLLAHVMTQFSSAFGFSVGGVLQNSLLNGKDGASGFVIEGDESDGSFLRIHPEGSIVTNIDPDHLDFWKDFNTLKLAYKSYLETIKNKELIFFAKDEVCDLIDFGTSYGIQKGDIQALDIQKTNKGSYFTILDLKQKLRLEKVFLPLFGDHQIKNALGVYGMSTRLGVPKDLVIESFKSFEGLKRRSEWIATIDKASIYLDYGHHPKELAATFHALREQLQKKLIVVFEPHKYSRTKSFFVEFLEVLKTADTLFLIETYPAAEAFDYEGSSEKLAKYLNIEVTPKKEVYDQLQGYIFTDVTILFIGAGNIDTVCKSFCEKCSDYARTRD